MSSTIILNETVIQVKPESFNQKLLELVTLDNYKQVMVLQGQYQDITLLVFNDDASKLVGNTTCLTIDTSFINSKLFPKKENIKLIEYHVIEDNKVVRCDFDELVNNITKDNYGKIIIVRLDNLTVYKYDKTTNVFQGENDVLPIDLSALETVYKFNIYFYDTNPLEVVYESFVHYAFDSSNNCTENQFNDMCTIMAGTIQPFIENRNIFKITVSQNDKEIGSFTNRGMYYSGKLFSTTRNLISTYKSACNKMMGYKNNVKVYLKCKNSDELNETLDQMYKKIGKASNEIKIEVISQLAKYC